MRIIALLQKIHQLADQAEKATAIDIDLMLDYTRVLYSDLLEWRDAAPKPVMPLEPGKEKPAVPAPPPAQIASPPKPPAPAPAAEPKPKPVEMAPPPPPQPKPQPVATPPPAPTGPAEPTLEEYMASLYGQAIHREPDAPLMNGATVDAAPIVEKDPIAVAAAPAPVPLAKPEAPAQPAPAPARDIRSMIGINDKYQIMSELFGNDKAAYEQALDVINRAESEQAAFNWLRERLWVTEDHSDAAMIFFDVVRRFKNA